VDNVIVIVGPTAVGKTKLSIDLAKRLNAEIISGDSMQVYKEMDIGTGKITEDEMENIWDRYYKADPSRKNTKYGESGLGLPIVKQIVELHDGIIEVTSEKGNGTCFVIKFPRTRLQNR